MKPQVSIYCPCNERDVLGIQEASTIEPTPNTSLDSLYVKDDLLNIIKDNNNNHSLLSVCLCTECHAIRCRKCMESEFLVNYCPGCLTFTNNEYNYCVRNCFVCPLCSSNVTISAVSTYNSKTFIFKCTQCTYRYDSGPLNKPKSLSNFIKSKAQNTAYYSQFSGLQKNHLVDSRAPRRDKQRVDISKLVKSLQNVNIHSTPATVRKLDEEADSKDAKLLLKLDHNDGAVVPYRQYLKSQMQYSLESISKTKLIKDVNKKENKPVYQQLLPLPRKLRAKKLLRCKVCRGTLVEPNLAENSFKYKTTSNANDFLPTVNVRPFPKHDNQLKPNNSLKYIFSFKNPHLWKDMRVKISTFDQNHSEYRSKVSLPCSSFVLSKTVSILCLNNQDRDDLKNADNESVLAKLMEPEHFIKTVPTCELTKTTKLARIELLSRTANSPFWTKISEMDTDNNRTVKSRSGLPSPVKYPPSSVGIHSSKFMYGDMQKLNPPAPYIAAQNVSKQSFSSSQESLSSSANWGNSSFNQSTFLSFFETDQPLDSGSNWCSIAINITLSDYNKHDYDLSIPLFITVEVDDTPFGYWILAKFGTVSID